MSDEHHAAHDPEQRGDLFLEFANTLELDDGVAVDRVADSAALARWLLASGATGSRLSRSRLEPALASFRELRDLVRGVVSRVADGRGPSDGQVRRLNRVLRDGLHHDQLRRNGHGGSFAMVPVGDPILRARAAIAGSLAHYLAEHDVDRLRVCASDDCRWLFVDRSPAARRRWCDMRTCGNRAKVARHRERARSAPPAPRSRRRSTASGAGRARTSG